MSENRNMLLPIPDDWNGTDYDLMLVCVPQSDQWRRIVKGKIAELTRGRKWDGNTGNIKNAQLVGVQILGSIEMACLADIQRIADALYTIDNDSNEVSIAKILYDNSVRGGSEMEAIITALEDLAPSIFEEVVDFHEFLKVLAAILPNINLPFEALVQLYSMVMDIRYRRNMLANANMINLNLRYLGNAIAPRATSDTEEEAEVSGMFAGFLKNKALLTAIAVLDPSPSGEIALAASLAVQFKSAFGFFKTIITNIFGGGIDDPGYPIDNVTSAIRALYDKDTCCPDPTAPTIGAGSIPNTVPFNAEKCQRAKEVVGIVFAVVNLLEDIQKQYADYTPTSVFHSLSNWLELGREHNDLYITSVFQNDYYNISASSRVFDYSQFETTLISNEQAIIDAIYNANNSLQAYTDIRTILDAAYPDQGDRQSAPDIDDWYRDQGEYYFSQCLFSQSLLNNVFAESWFVDSESRSKFATDFVSVTCSGASGIPAPCDPQRAASIAGGVGPSFSSGPADGTFQSRSVIIGGFSWKRVRIILDGYYGMNISNMTDPELQGTFTIDVFDCDGNLCEYGNYAVASDITFIGAEFLITQYQDVSNFDVDLTFVADDVGRPC